MLTAKELRFNAKNCLELADRTNEVYAKEALKALAQRLNVTPASPNVASAISLTIPGFKRLSNRGFVQLPKAGQDAADSERAGNRANVSRDVSRE
jgi:hypothetical protein